MGYNCMLTTADNPYDPFEDFTLWYMFDMLHGYDCCGKLDRIANIEKKMMQFEIDIEVERAIDQIVAEDFTNTYKKVKKELIMVEEDQ